MSAVKRYIVAIGTRSFMTHAAPPYKGKNNWIEAYPDSFAPYDANMPVQLRASDITSYREATPDEPWPIGG